MDNFTLQRNIFSLPNYYNYNKYNKYITKQKNNVQTKSPEVRADGPVATS